MSNIYAKILEKVERGEAATLQTEFSGAEGSIRECLSKSLAPYAPQLGARGRRFADVTLTETDAVLPSANRFRPRSASSSSAQGISRCPCVNLQQRAALRCTCATTAPHLQTLRAFRWRSKCFVTALSTASADSKSPLMTTSSSSHADTRTTLTACGQFFRGHSRHISG